MTIQQVVGVCGHYPINNNISNMRTEMQNSDNFQTLTSLI